MPRPEALVVGTEIPCPLRDPRGAGPHIQPMIWAAHTVASVVHALVCASWLGSWTAKCSHPGHLADRRELLVGAVRRGARQSGRSGHRRARPPPRSASTICSTPSNPTRWAAELRPPPHRTRPTSFGRSGCGALVNRRAQGELVLTMYWEQSFLPRSPHKRRRVCEIAPGHRKSRQPQPPVCCWPLDRVRAAKGIQGVQRVGVDDAVGVAPGRRGTGMSGDDEARPRR
jgi:hypothetical protein